MRMQAAHGRTRVVAARLRGVAAAATRVSFSVGKVRGHRKSGRRAVRQCRPFPIGWQILRRVPQTRLAQTLLGCISQGVEARSSNAREPGQRVGAFAFVQAEDVPCPCLRHTTSSSSSRSLSQGGLGSSAAGLDENHVQEAQARSLPFPLPNTTRLTPPARPALLPPHPPPLLATPSRWLPLPRRRRTPPIILACATPISHSRSTHEVLDSVFSQPYATLRNATLFPGSDD